MASEEETRSVEELERLRTQKEIIELRKHIQELRAPWWRKASLIATVTALLAGILPATTAIQEHYRNERELQLQQAKQDSEIALAQARQQTDIMLEQTKQENDIRMAYLDRFEHPGRRLQTLRFLLATSTDPKLLAWAREEKEIVEGLVAEIDKDLVAVRKKMQEAPPGPLLDELRKERDRLSELKDMTTRKPPPSKTAPE